MLRLKKLNEFLVTHLALKNLKLQNVDVNFLSYINHIAKAIFERNFHRLRKPKLYILVAIVMMSVIGIASYQGGIFNNPKDIVLPEDIKNLDEKSAERIRGLSEPDKTLLMQYMMRREMVKAFGGIDKGGLEVVTVGEAISRQKDFLEKRKEKEIEEEALKEQVEKRRQAMASQFSDAMVVSLVNKELVEQDYSKAIAIKIAFQNKSTKDIAGVKGIAFFKDIFGDEISKSALSIDNEMPAGKTTIWYGSQHFNQFDATDKKLASTDKEKIKFEFQPEVILFKDGTKIDINEK